MPAYVYRHLDHSWEEIRPMSESSWTASCPTCPGENGKRDLRAELATPQRFREYVDIHATGKPILMTSKRQKAAVLKSLGLHELGNEPLKGMQSEMRSQKTFFLPPAPRGNGAMPISSPAVSVQETSG